MADQDLRARREAVVKEHMDSENRHEYDATMATFGHPRYEIIPTGDVYDGEDAVRQYFAETRTAFPDQRNRPIRLHHADDAVIAEFHLDGTHLGPLRGLPATGRAFTCQMVAIFEFEGEGIVCERVYFDSVTILQQLGVAHDPQSLRGRVATVMNHPLTIGAAVVRRLARREAR